MIRGTRSCGLVWSAASAALACAPLAAVQEEPAPARRPNVVLILADDVGLGDLGCYNDESKVPTPNLDRLAGEGLRMTDAHSPSGVCSPTRYGLLTGRYAWRSSLKRGVLWGESPLLVEPERPTLASFLGGRGYHTACIGKWHLGLGAGRETDYSKPLRPGPLELGFDVFFGIPASADMAPYVYVDGDRPVEAATETTPGSAMRRSGGEGFWRPGPIAPGFVHEEILPKTTQKALEYLEQRAAHPDTPFFLYFALTAAHTPWVPTEEFQGKSGAGPYGDFVVQIDDTVGRVLEALERHGLADDTLVVFTSDNGAHWEEEDIARYGHRANLDYRGQKADIWEAGHRVPFLARWPGEIPPGATSDETICHVDLFATLAAILGADVPDDAAEDSYDVSAALRGADLDRPLREATVLHSFHGMFAIRQGRWKLILGLGSGGFTHPAVRAPEPGEPPGQLYDLAADPREERNLYAEEPEVVTRLFELLERYVESGRSRPGAVGHAAEDR